MSIKKKLPLIFTLLVLCILIGNNTLHFMRSKQALVRHNEKEIELITQEISFQVENAKEGALYVEDIIGRELRTASIAIKNSLPANHEDVTNEQLKALADELMLSHITLLAKTEDDIIGVKSSDLHEINMSTKEWGYWYEAFQQLFSLSPVKVEKGVALPNYWTGPIEKASTNPHHTDKWGYFYDGSTNYIINPYFRDDQILKYEKQFGPGKVIDRFTSELEGVLELTVFNPAVFGKEKKVIYKNGNSYVKRADEEKWYGTYEKYTKRELDTRMVQKAIETGEKQNYTEIINGKNVRKTFVPVQAGVDEPYVIGITYDYGLIQKELQRELIEHILLSIPFILIVLITSFIFSRSITKPIGSIVGHVNEIAEGKFGKQLHLKRRDELGLLTKNINALSKFLQGHVADLKQSQEVIEFQAYHDPLTGLPNRRFLQEELKKLVDCTKQRSGTVAVLFVDIDRFKDINDSLGHAMGDQLIKLVANRIKRSLSNPDIMVTRQGGDEFVILFNWLGEEQVKEEAETVITAIKQPFIIEGNEINVSASGGLSLYPRHTENLDTLMVYADIAMYTAKKQGGSKVVLYSEEINVRSQEKLRIETRLRTAIKEEKIDVYYQPKVDGRTDTITGAEALLRWTDEELGFVPPDKFISIAEDTGLIHSLWELVMKKACSQVSKWNENQSQPLNLAVNFSAKQFQDPVRLVEQVVSILADSKLLPQHFEVEITESILFNNTNETIKALKKLQEYGIGISIDDFGTGYSSLGYLKTLPIDILKIDRTFIQDIKEDYSNAEIPKAIITMAHGLRLKVIAEGVEEEHQKEFLLKNDCYLMQGYLFSKPLSKENFEKLIKDSY